MILVHISNKTIKIDFSVNFMNLVRKTVPVQKVNIVNRFKVNDLELFNYFFDINSAIRVEANKDESMLIG